MLGNVQTHITKTSTRLPGNSIYHPIEDIYQSRRIDHFHGMQFASSLVLCSFITLIGLDGAFPRQPVADAIVFEALKDHPPAWWWGGKNAWATWFLYTFLGRRFIVRRIVSLSLRDWALTAVQDWLLSRIFGLNTLAARRARDRKSA